MAAQLPDYLSSSRYVTDLEATREMWSGPDTLGTTGVFIFLSYLTIPTLTAVHPAGSPGCDGSMRMGLDSDREKRFLLRLLGMSDEPGWANGIKNPKVQSMAVRLAAEHSRFNGMKQSYMSHFAGIIAISVLRVRARYDPDVHGDRWIAYWSYTRNAFSLLGVTLTTPRNTEHECEAFTQAYAGRDHLGLTLLRVLLQMYPHYVERALPLLFFESRVAAISMLEKACAHLT